MALLPRYFTRLRKVTDEDRTNAKAEEHPDPTPMAPPIGYKRQPSLFDQVRDMVRNAQLQNDLAAQGVETMEEADDFDVGDDYDPRSPFEVDFDPGDNLTPLERAARVPADPPEAEERPVAPTQKKPAKKPAPPPEPEGE